MTGSGKRQSLGRSFLGIKAWWVLMAFLSGLAIAVVTENLILEHRNNRLEFSAPRTDFFEGKSMTRLQNALEVPFLIQTTLWSGNRSHVFARAADRFMVSMDIFADTPNAFTVVKTEFPAKRVSHLTAKQAQAWCLSQMSLDTTGLPGGEPLWAELKILAEDPSREGNILGSSVNSTGISLIPLIDFFSHQPGQHASWVLDYDAFTLDQLQHTRD